MTQNPTSPATRQQSLYIAGQYVSTQKKVPVGHPFSKDLSQYHFSFIDNDSPVQDLEIIEAALESAQLTFTHAQKNSDFFSLKERKHFFKKLATHFRDSRDNLARLLMLEIGKPIRLARLEIDRSIEVIDLVSQSLDENLSSQIFNASAFERGPLKAQEVRIDRIARGPLFAMTPFNFPVLLALHKILPSLALGNPVILKPSPKAPLITAAMVDLIHASDIPQGFLSLLNTSNDLVLKILKDSRVAHFSFTGSPQVGWFLQSQAQKPCTLELGGASPCYVSENLNTEHIQKIATQIAVGAYSFAGQACISTQNIYCHEKTYEVFKDAFIKAVQEFPTGSPLEEETLCGPVIDLSTAEKLRKIKSALSNALGKTWGQADSFSDAFVSPCFFEIAPKSENKKTFENEMFGPIRSLSKTSESLGDWIERMNRSPYRLQAQVMTHSEIEKKQAIRELNFGTLVINGPSLRFDSLPFGGQGLAGLGTEGPRFALQEMSFLKSTTVF
jgi:acyl-CoA reductase-like NAD-dependent aldehyde dehydrogenase